jgi:phospholipid N-methyltransferase
MSKFRHSRLAPPGLRLVDEGQWSMSGIELREFLTQLRAAPRAVGAIAPSSRALAEAMVAPIDFAQAGAIVELGPGTGSITAAIARRLNDRTRYLGIEISEGFCRTLKRRFPGLDFVNGSAEDLQSILIASGIDAVDTVICGLPWASLPTELQTRILAGVVDSLRPGGVFVTFAYLQGLLLPAARALRRRLRREFAIVETTRIVWGNLPPAFAYVCRK